MTYATIPEFKAALDAQIGIESVLTESQGSSHLTYCSPTGWPLFLVEAYQDDETIRVGGVGAPALEASVKVNVPENARLTFDHVANDKIQEMIDSNFKFYKQITDDPTFEKFLLDWMFERYNRLKNKAG